MQRRQIQHVYYNDLNTGVVELLRDVMYNGVSEKYFRWIDRETFHTHKLDADWYGGLCKTVWSFGNGQKKYLFGRHNEALKKLAHHAIVNRCGESLKEINRTLGTDIPACILSLDGLHQRRLALGKEARRVKRCGLQRLQQLEQLQRIQLLVQLEQVGGAGKLKTYNLPYEQVPITSPPDKTVIYLDPPYNGTEGYQAKVDHGSLGDWIKDSPYKVYLSGYGSGFNQVAQWQHRTTLGPANNAVIERLFTNNPAKCGYSVTA
jgi:hypothetical protein